MSFGVCFLFFYLSVGGVEDICEGKGGLRREECTQIGENPFLSRELTPLTSSHSSRPSCSFLFFSVLLLTNC